MPNHQGRWSLTEQYQAIAQQAWTMTPSEPRNVIAVSRNSAVRISFDEPSFFGEPGVITEYVVTNLNNETITTGTSSPIIVSNLTNDVSYSFNVKAINAIGASKVSSTVTSTPQVSDIVYDTPGTYSWIAPSGVSNITVIAIGGGGGGHSQNGSGGWGGAGGGLGWKNNITVTPGQSYTVVVGARGERNEFGVSPATNGGDSYFISIQTVAGAGGQGGAINSGAVGGGYSGDGGGFGGNVPSHTNTAAATGGGGAGGYAGNGGDAGNAGTNNAQAGSGGGGGGGGAGGSSDAAGAGGGVGILGEGANGAGGTYGGANGGPGGGGSGGTNGSASPGSTANPSTGGAYGGGGGGAELVNENGPGGGGAVRIAWGIDDVITSTSSPNVIAIPGQQAYTTAGTYSWVAPAGVTSVSVVAIGGGAGGYGNVGGAGGELRYINNTTVIPGSSYTVVVGDRGQHYLSGNDDHGKPSSFSSVLTANGGGIQNNWPNDPVVKNYLRTAGFGGTGYLGGEGGQGGAAGGGGAGGYSGTGGTGGSPGVNGQSGGGGAGGGGAGGSGSMNPQGGSGGGVGIFGESASGAGGSGLGVGGGGGSGGTTGGNGNVGCAATSTGTYGAGGGSGNNGNCSSFGAAGAVRIIWGAGRAFPSTNTQDV